METLATTDRRTRTLRFRVCLVLCAFLLSVEDRSALAQGAAAVPGSSQNTAEIVPGAPSLDPTVIRAHQAAWRIVQVESGEELGRFERSVDRVVHVAGEPAILTRWHFTTPQRSALDIYYLDSESLLPVARYVTAPNGMWVQYQSKDRLVASLTRRTGGEPVYVDMESPGPRFNNAMFDFVLASLPLADGYAARWPTLGTSGRSLQEALSSVRAQVEGRETVSLPDGRELEAWRVAIERPGGNPQLVWIAKEPPYLLRRDVLDRQGNVTVRWELTSSTTP